MTATEAQQLERQVAEAAAQIGIASNDDQYLTFMLAGEEYGVDILRVQEIKGWDKVTPVPNTPDFMQGVINLRGSIVPVIDLRLRFGLEKRDYGPTTVVVVLRVVGERSERIMGIVVDAVSDVYSIPEQDFRPAPKNGDVLLRESVRSLATVNDKMVIVLDIDRLLNWGELAVLDGIRE